MTETDRVNDGDGVNEGEKINVWEAKRRESDPRKLRTNQEYFLTHFYLSLEKLVPSIPALDYGGNRPTESLRSVRIRHRSCDLQCLLTRYDDVVYRIKIPGIHYQYQNNAQWQWYLDNNPLPANYNKWSEWCTIHNIDEESRYTISRTVFSVKCKSSQD